MKSTLRETENSERGEGAARPTTLALYFREIRGEIGSYPS